MILILFGVSAVGKTTIGQIVALRLGWRFADADDYHSPANKQKMQRGIPLDDTDRAPWLQTLNSLLVDAAHAGQNVVLACSALKEKYRQRLVEGLPFDAFLFVLLDAQPDLLAQRIRQRNHPYMNPNLLNSQLKTLEVPQDVCKVSVRGTPDEAAEEVLACLKARPPHHTSRVAIVKGKTEG